MIWIWKWLMTLVMKTEDVDGDCVLPPNVTFTNDNVRWSASYQMKLFWHCCLQRGSAVELLNYGKLKRKLRKGLLYDWLSTRCQVKPKRVRQLWKFYKHFFYHIKKVVGYKLPFIWFDRDELSVDKYFDRHLTVAMHNAFILF